MKPEENKWYRIEYRDKDEPERNYCGIGRCLELSEVDGNTGESLWNFETPDNLLYGLFGEEDIKEEVKAPTECI